MTIFGNFCENVSYTTLLRFFTKILNRYQTTPFVWLIPSRRPLSTPLPQTPSRLTPLVPPTVLMCDVWLALLGQIIDDTCRKFEKFYPVRFLNQFHLRGDSLPITSIYSKFKTTLFLIINLTSLDFSLRNLTT